MKQIALLILLIICTFSCSNSNYNNASLEELNTLRTELDSLKNLHIERTNDIKGQIETFLTFQDNNAENAMNFYIDLFDNSKIINIKRWEKGGPTEEGKIMVATFDLNGRRFKCSDSPPIHDWNFTPAVSNYIECKNEDELKRLFSKLSKNGSITMPLNNYGFSQKFGWVIDQFGISWQLNLQ